MKDIARYLSIIFLGIILTGVGFIPESNADERSCYLEASNTDVFVIVFDLDRDGNQGQQIWQGRINQGESVLITTSNRRFRYDYKSQPDEDQPFSGGYDRWCNDKKTLLVL